MGVLQVLSQSPHSVSRWMPSGTGRHGLDERPNAIGTEQAGKMRPRFVDRVCPAIPGRALPTVVNLATADGTVRGKEKAQMVPEAKCVHNANRGQAQVHWASCSCSEGG